MNTKLITLNELNERTNVVFTDIAKIKYDEALKDKAHTDEYYALIHDLTDGKYIVLDIVRNNVTKVETQETNKYVAEHEGYLYRTIAQTSNSHIPVKLLTFMNDKINAWTIASNEGCILSVEDID